MGGQHSFTEENYLKAIYTLNQRTEKGATTTAIAEHLGTKAASVTEMMKKLSEKDLVNYRKYKRISLTNPGKEIAISIIRKHRLWEVFLVNKLGFGWDEVHDMAEELEHIQSDRLTEQLDRFLGHPTHDPHGDPIPDKDGHISSRKEVMLFDLNTGESGVVIGVKDSSNQFLKHLDKQGIKLGTEICFEERFEYDESLRVTTDSKTSIILSNMVSKNLLVKRK